jgi:hypothetical protein
MLPKHKFQTSLALHLNSFYADRPADQQLYDALFAGELCHVLAPRQTGKSSLRVRTELRLKEAGVHTATVDMTGIGARGVSAEQFFRGLIRIIAQALKLPDEPSASTHFQDGLSPSQRWVAFLREELLSRLSGPIVIFIDEIDTLLALDHSIDDFLISIRHLSDASASTPVLRRLTFCLLGAVTPSDLLPDSTRTPFNTGRRIDLVDFDRDALDVFLPGLSGFADPARVLDRIFYWTSGHPYMTHALCCAIAKQALELEESPSPDEVIALVDAEVMKSFLESGRTTDKNLSAIDAWFSRQSGRSRLRVTLQRYEQILIEGSVPLDPNDPVQVTLRLSGLVTLDPHGPLRPRNLIVRSIFDVAWVRSCLNEQIIADPLVRWIDAGRSNTFLLRGAHLREAEAWQHARNDLITDEKDFIARSQAAERRRSRTRTLALVSGLAITAGSAAISIYLQHSEHGALLEAKVEKAKTEKAKREAEQAQKKAEQARRELDVLVAREKQARINADLNGARALRKAEEEIRDQVKETQLAADRLKTTLNQISFVKEKDRVLENTNRAQQELIAKLKDQILQTDGLLKNLTAQRNAAETRIQYLRQQVKEEAEKNLLMSSALEDRRNSRSK